jgi:hypothetical protein
VFCALPVLNLSKDLEKLLFMFPLPVGLYKVLEFLAEIPIRYVSETHVFHSHDIFAVSKAPQVLLNFFLQFFKKLSFR